MSNRLRQTSDGLSAESSIGNGRVQQKSFGVHWTSSGSVKYWVFSIYALHCRSWAQLSKYMALSSPLLALTNSKDNGPWPQWMSTKQKMDNHGQQHSSWHEPLHCDIMAILLPFHFYVIVILLWYHWHFIAIFHFYVIVISLWYHWNLIAIFNFHFIPISLPFHCYLIPVSLLFHCHFISISLWYHCYWIAISFPFHLLYRCYFIVRNSNNTTMIWQWNRNDITMISQWNSNEMGTK